MYPPYNGQPSQHIYLHSPLKMYASSKVTKSNEYIKINHATHVIYCVWPICKKCNEFTILLTISKLFKTSFFFHIWINIYISTLSKAQPDLNHELLLINWWLSVLLGTLLKVSMNLETHLFFRQLQFIWRGMGGSSGRC